MTMPNFLIIGAMKAGTTALYAYLQQHPQVYMSPLKEPNFFAFEGERMDFRAPQDQQGINRTSVTDVETYRALFKEVRSEKAIGEASHWYLYSPRAPERIRYYIPEVKLIAVLRDPVERAYSEWLHFIRDGEEPVADFARALREEETRKRYNWAFGHYASRGFYHAQLKRYFDAFDRGQIKIYLYEDLSTDPIGVLGDIFQFLGVDRAFLPRVPVKPNVSGVPKNRALHALLTRPQRIKAFVKPHLPAGLLRFASDVKNRNLVKPQLASETRRQMRDMYQEDVLRLQALIDRDLTKWLE
jgi:hypothetical protein